MSPSSSPRRLLRVRLVASWRLGLKRWKGSRGSMVGLDRMSLSYCFSGFDGGAQESEQFLLEGLATIIVAGIAYFTMHDVCSFPLPSAPTFHFLTFGLSA